MSSQGAAAPRAAVIATSARAQASRINGARSRGPRSAEGKARSARNALRHGLRAQKFVLLHDEDPSEFQAFQAALTDELAPRGALQSMLAARIALAGWRLQRADRMEAELFGQHLDSVRDGDLALALIRDGNGPRAFDTLLRYRGAALAEFWRALRTLKALQAEQEEAPKLARQAEAAPAPVLVFEPARVRAATCSGTAPDQRAGRPKPRQNPIEPESRGNAGGPEPARPAGEAVGTRAGAGREPATPKASVRERLMAGASYSLARTLT